MTEVRDRVFDNPTEKLVAMRLADCGNDDGAAIYPKVSTLADDCLIKERRAQEILAKFQAMKLLVLVQEARGHRQRVYRLDPDVLCTLPLTASAQARRARKEARQPTARGAAQCTPREDRGAAECTPRGAAQCTPIETVQRPVLSKEGKPSLEGARTPFALTAPERPPPKRGSRLPETWQPSARDLAFAASEGLSEEEARREAEQFRDHWISSSGAKACKRDWPAAWRTWVRNAVKWQRERSRPGSGRRGPPSAARAFARAAGLDPDQVDRPD
ncbi:MAG: hypothetical protein Kow00114_32860 [Kiloniellaceae bacterium]